MKNMNDVEAIRPSNRIENPKHDGGETTVGGEIDELLTF